MRIFPRNSASEAPTDGKPLGRFFCFATRNGVFATGGRSHFEDVRYYVMTAKREETSGASAEGFAMWKVENERYFVELAPGRPDSIKFWATRNMAVKDDGTRIRESGGGREGEEFFNYEDAGRSFKFTASRHDQDQNLASVYRIYLGPFLPNGTTLDEAQMIARNIREALLILPPSQVRHHGEWPTNVTFDMSSWNKRHRAAQAGENFPENAE